MPVPLARFEVLRTAASVALAIALACAGRPAEAASVAIHTSAAASVQDSAPPNGTFDTVFFGSELEVFANSTFSGTSRGAFAFSLASAPAPAVIESITLTLFPQFIVSGGSLAAQLFGQGGDGTITVADVTGGTLLASFTALNNPGSPPPVVFDLTAFMLPLLSGGEDFASFYVRTPLESSSGFSGVLRAGSTSPTASSNPLLTFNFTQVAIPLPATAFLLTAGALVLAAVRRLP